MFSKEYISLIAGLREFTLDSDFKGLDVVAIREEVFEELSSEDAKSVQLLYNYYDCENLVAAHSSRNHYNELGMLSKEQIDELLQGVQGEDVALDGKIVEVVIKYSSKGGGAVDGGEGLDSFDTVLFSTYYEVCEASSNRLLSQWSLADRNLRSVIAALVARLAGSPIESVVVGGGDVVEQLLRSSAADFSLRGELDYIDEVMGAVGDEQNILDKEHKIDMVRWGIVEELAQMEYFSLDALIAYLVRVNIVARWKSLDMARGAELFKRLLEELGGKDKIN